MNKIIHAIESNISGTSVSSEFESVRCKKEEEYHQHKQMKLIKTWIIVSKWLDKFPKRPNGRPNTKYEEGMLQFVVVLLEKTQII